MVDSQMLQPGRNAMLRPGFSPKGNTMHVKLNHFWSGHGDPGDIVEVDEQTGNQWIAEKAAFAVDQCDIPEPPKRGPGRPKKVVQDAEIPPDILHDAGE